MPRLALGLQGCAPMTRMGLLGATALLLAACGGITAPPGLSFAPAASYQVGLSPGPYSVAMADLNGDGKPDLAVANGSNSLGNGLLGVLLNNGDGTFAPAAYYLV